MKEAENSSKRAKEIQRQIEAKALEAKKKVLEVQKKASINPDHLDTIREVIRNEIRGELAEAMKGLAATNEKMMDKVTEHLRLLQMPRDIAGSGKTRANHAARRQ